MYDNVVNFESFRAERLLFAVLGVVLAQVDSDFAQLCPVDAVGGGGDVPVVQQDPATLVGADPDVGLPWQLRKLRLLPPNNSLGELAVTRDPALRLVLQELHLLPSLKYVFLLPAQVWRLAAGIQKGITAWKRKLNEEQFTAASDLCCSEEIGRKLTEKISFKSLPCNDL